MTPEEEAQLLANVPTLETVQKIFSRHKRSIDQSILAVESVPRLGFTDHSSCALELTIRLGIKTEWHQGVYWAQVLTNAIEKVISRGYLYVLTIDYDTIFTPQDVVDLYTLLEENPHMDAVCGVQVARDRNAPLMMVTDETDQWAVPVTPAGLAAKTLQLKTGHFGLTLLRASAFAAVERPWFGAIPDPDGCWHDGHLDSDIAFWHRWHKAGKTLYQANHVTLGHNQLMVSWPDQDLKPIHQYTGDWKNHGKPVRTLNYRSPQQQVDADEQIRLNLGSGSKELPGFTNVDRLDGKEVYPLAWPDESVEEIYASHILEHFPQNHIIAVLSEWIRTLKPGGLLRIAVPDLDRILEARKQGDPLWPLYLMGGNTLDNDWHGAVFDRLILEGAMELVGLENIQTWESTIGDCASMPVSLNLQGTKRK